MIGVGLVPGLVNPQVPGLRALVEMRLEPGVMQSQWSEPLADL